MTGFIALAVAWLLLGAATACSTDDPEPVTLRVLASSGLADMRPVLDDLRRETGIRLEMDYRGTVDASNALAPGGYRHDLAWLSSDRYFRLKLKEAGRHTEKPLATSIMRSPVVIGMKSAAADRLRRRTSDGQISWADAADAAADGSLRFGMADPRHTNSGLAALVGVATAAAGTGGALRPQDVSCDRLRGFFTGHRLTEDSSDRLAGGFVQRQDDLDALITYESELLSLNSSGKLRKPLEIVYPKDGMVLSDYPLLLLDPAKRAAYDRLVDWLKSEPVQKKIMERTLRRPIDPGVPRIPRLREPVGNALYFPDDQKVVDRLLADYGDPRRDRPARVIFLLDFSGSMRGERIAQLRATFDGLSGADDSRSGKFVRFYRGESLTVMRFGGRVLDERNVTYERQGDLDRLRGFVASDDFGESTAIWSTLDHAYQKVSGIVRDHPAQAVSIVLMTDGENNAGMDLDAFVRQYETRPPAARAVRTYTIRYGEADTKELHRAARATGGRMVDATAQSLLSAFKEIRGCVQ
ncbi:VWA domain-containing protein [Streptomyces sp. NBC_01142]|uniref:substrate-binding and vWA domain-containing protein n=1 Tax=Streptomyces sp. NBC_01142 TaxID=2975865 RepID=UPI0022532A40|nr:VWA domain-containing protein [Streptomyces sp. NBC_01142]MCX4825514.1 VWA domain-containing protein [Streptomyces sp. NBC_01142]